jgi:hypothetical protein
MRHAKLTKKLRFETLETRRLLDGNVTANFTGGVLTLHGDSTSNGIAIFNTSGNVVEVLGLNQASAPTTVGGAPSQLFQHVVSIVLDFNNGQTGVNQGDDALVLTKLHLTGSVSIGLGTGSDIVALGNFDNSGGLVDSAVDANQGAVKFDKGLTIDLQGGANTLVAKDATLNGHGGPNITITGAGDDSLSFDHVAVNHAIAITETGTTTMSMTQGLCNSMKLSLGIGNDNISIDHTTVGHAFVIKADAGDDSISLGNVGADSLHVDLGDGENDLTVENTAVTHDTLINGGGASDSVTLDTVTTRPLTILLGDGDDQVSMTTLTAKTTEIHGGTGADTTSASDVHSKIFTVLGGNGADQITLDSIIASKRIALDAGAGDDVVSVNHSAAKSVTIQLGDGSDSLSLDTDTIARKALLLGGAGNDSITADTLAAASLKAILDTGNDDISLANTAVSGKAKLNGGPGSDTYTDASGNTFGNLSLKSIGDELNPLLGTNSYTGPIAIEGGTQTGSLGATNTYTGPTGGTGGALTVSGSGTLLVGSGSDLGGLVFTPPSGLVINAGDP